MKDKQLSRAQSRPHPQKIWENEVRDVFKQIKSHRKPYEIVVLKKRLIVYPNVFSPKYFTDSKWFAETLPKIVGNKSLLEIGTATGIVSLFVALNGATVTATDLSDDAVDNARKNFETHKVDIPVLKGNMYEPLPENAKFDFIFWNHPFNKGDDPDEPILLRAGFDYQYHALEDYVAGARKHLTANGKLLLGSGNFAYTEEIERIARQNGFRLKIIERANVQLTEGSKIKNEYYIYSFEDKLRKK